MIERLYELKVRLGARAAGSTQEVNGRRFKPTFNIRTLWISDVHLGSRKCQAEALLDFLEHVRCEELYLVGDIVDVVSLKRNVHWPDSHTQVLRKLMDLRQSGARVTYIPGNHGDPFRAFVGQQFAGISLRKQAIHVTRQNKRLLVIHGDLLDTNVQCNRLLRHLGAWAYDRIMQVNTRVNRIRRLLGLPYWSLASQLKKRVGRALEYVQAYEQGMAGIARQANVDGVICGHIHQPAMKTIGGRVYCNDGDWVESCSALVEHKNGELELIHWQQHQVTSNVLSIRAAAAKVA